MKYFRKSASIWHRYFISYIAIFAIPLIILGALLYNHTIIELQNEVEKYTLDKVEKMSTSLDDRLLETKKIALKISSNEDITPYSSNLNDYRSKYAIDQLNRYWDKYFIDNLFVYFSGENYIYNVNGKMSFNTMYTSVLGLNENSAIKFINTIKSVNSPILLGLSGAPSSVSGRKDILLCLYPLPLGGASYYGTVGIIINQSTIENLAGDILGGSKGSIFIFNNDGQKIFTLGDNEFYPAENAMEFAANSYPTGISSTIYNGSKLSIIKRVSDASGFRYVLIMSPESYLSRVIVIRKQVMLVIFIVILVGVILAFIFSARSYRPIRGIFEKLNNYGHNNQSKIKEPNEIVNIEKMLDNIIEKNYGLTEQLSYHKDFVRDHIILMLLKGQLNGKENIENLTELYKVNFNYEYFFISIISIHDKKESEITSSELNLYINTVVGKKIINKDFYLVDTIQGDVVMLFNTTPENCETNAVLDLLKELQDFLSNKLVLKTSIGVGRSYNDLTLISRSFMEASSALEHMFMAGDDNIIFFDKLVSEDKMVYWYPLEEQIRLVQCIKQGNIYIFKDIIDGIINSINKKHLPVSKTKTICFGMINKIIEILNELDIKEFNDEVEDLITFSSLSDFKIKMESLVYNICKHIEESKESNNENLKISIINYIHEHYTNNMLSLDMVAQEFHISSKYLSRFFKQQMGYNFIDYIKELRINYAKKLLKESDKSIKDIVEEIGYTDAASFTRTFRQNEGITPGKYREVLSK